MIVTIRTLARSDGQTSVVLTHQPGRPADPEVVHVCPTSRQAVEWVMEQVQRIVLQAGEGFRTCETRYSVVPDAPCHARARLMLELPSSSRVGLE